MRKIWLGMLVAGISLFLYMPVETAQAKIDFLGNDTLALSGTYEDDMMAAGGLVSGDVAVQGDAFIAGSNINIGGVYNDDLNVAGSQVEISGVVKDNLRAAGGSVSIDAQVNGNVMVAGGQITIKKDTVIDGDLFVAGGMIVIDGEVKGDVHVSGGQVVVGGKVLGDLVIEAEDFNLTDSALVEGDLSYTAKKEIGDSGEKIKGQINFEKYSEAAKKVGGALAGVSIMAMIWDFILGLLMLFVVGLVIVLLVPESAEVVTYNYSRNLWASLLYGIIALIVLPILAIIFCITIVGIPLGLIMLVLYSVGLYLSVVFAALALGSLILKRKDQNWAGMLLSLALGVLLLEIISIVPLVGGLVYFILMVVGFGAMIYSLVNRHDMIKMDNTPVKAVAKGKAKGK